MKLTIDTAPVPKGRPRFTRSGHVYTPKRTRDFERLVGLTYKAHGGRLHAGEVIVDLVFYYSRKSDIDNLVKAVFDGLNGAAWNDDIQVAELHARRVKDPDPRIDLTVTDIPESLTDAPQRPRKGRGGSMKRQTLSMAIVALIGLGALTGCQYVDRDHSNSGHGPIPSIYPTVECKDLAGLEPCREVALAPGLQFPKYLHGVCFDPPLDTTGQCYFNCPNPLQFRKP